MSVLERVIADELRLPEKEISMIVNGGHSSYKAININKRDGGKRYVFIPSSEIKMLQIWAVERIIGKLPVSDICMSFRKGRSILDNAKIHRNSRFFFKTDIQNFFPSIRIDFFMKIFENNMEYISKNDSALAGVEFSEYENFFKKICFSKSGSLPIGYASSPSISNSVMFDFDEEIIIRLKKEFSAERKKSFFLTRYSDDFIFSSDEKEKCKVFYKIFKQTISDGKYNFLRINYKKSKLMEKNYGNVNVTGLRILKDSSISLAPAYKSQIRLFLKLFKKGEYSGGHDKLLGHISYVKHNDPAFYNLLITKYIDVIEGLK